MQQHETSKKKAFSLVELAIVIVVTGVLIVGITKVKSLISLSQTRATQITQNPYKAATIPLAESVVAWFSASSQSNLEQSGGLVTTWKDLSGNENHATTLIVHNSATDYSGNLPTYVSSGVNGKPALAFDGDYLMFDGSNLKSGFDHTIFIVEESTHSKNDTPVQVNIMSFFDNTANQGIYFNRSFNDFYVYYGSFIGAHKLGEVEIRGFTLPYIVNSTRIMSFVVSDSGVASDDNIYNNGTKDDNNTGSSDAWGAPASTTNNIVIGAKGGSEVAPTNPYTGNIAEIIIYDKALNVDELNKVYEFLSKKYGITVIEIT